MKKKKRQSLIREYNRIGNPNWWWIALQTISQFTYAIMKAIDTVFAARVTVGVYTGITTGNYRDAYVNLIIQLSLMIVRQLIVYLNYYVYSLVYDRIFDNIQRKIISKVINANREEFEYTNEEKILNIIQNDVHGIANISDLITTKLSFIVQVVVSVAVVFKANYIVGLILLAVCFTNYLILKVLNNKIAFASKKKSEAKDDILYSARRIMNSRDVIKEFKVEENYDDYFVSTCDEWNKWTARHWRLKGLKDTGFYAYYAGAAMLLTFLMIFFVSRGLDMELYLIVVPYLLTVSQNFNSFFEVTLDIADFKVYLSRVKTVLNFSVSEIKKFGSLPNTNETMNISFVGVSYNNSSKYSPYVGRLNDVDISFAARKLNILCGPKKCGKRLIFNMLRRRINPDSGAILLDNINISDLDTNDFKKKIYYCAGRPVFLDGSIMENLMVSTRSKKKIIETCKLLEIFDEIADLPNGFDTNLDAAIPRGLQFLIGMARALLTGCDTLMIYELPSAISNDHHKKIMRAIARATINHTVILFTHEESYNDMAKIIYYINDGEVTDTKINAIPDLSCLSSDLDHNKL